MGRGWHLWQRPGRQNVKYATESGVACGGPGSVAPGVKFIGRAKFKWETKTTSDLQCIINHKIGWHIHHSGRRIEELQILFRLLLECGNKLWIYEDLFCMHAKTFWGQVRGAVPLFCVRLWQPTLHHWRHCFQPQIWNSRLEIIFLYLIN